MTSNISLYKVEDGSGKQPFPYRILHVQDTLGMNERRELIEFVPPADAAEPIYTLNTADQTELAALVSTHTAFLEAKRSYVAAAEQFWKSSTGAAFDACLHPDQPEYDRSILTMYAKRFETYFSSLCVSIVDHTRNLRGYNHIRIYYRAILYESQAIPRTYEGFKLISYMERPVHEVPKLWHNKMKYETKKEVYVTYAYGHELPPYRLNDIEEMRKKNIRRIENENTAVEKT